MWIPCMRFRLSSALISTTRPDYDLRFRSASLRNSRGPERISGDACELTEEALQLTAQGPFCKPLVRSVSAGRICPGDAGAKAFPGRANTALQWVAPEGFWRIMRCLAS